MSCPFSNVVQVLTAILCYDIWFYLSHVLLHTRALRSYHAVHHKYETPTMWQTYAGHWLEGPFQGVGLLIPFRYPCWQFLIALVLVNLRGIMRHDERFVWLIGNHHLLHHKYPKYNFGEYWIDSVFGTRYPEKAAYQRGLIYL
jgi:sterol desaturase/sphingolipid hydroxylase (fatty acid hydroxylase superfamily)